MAKFMPATFKLTATYQPPLKDQYDEWLARIICYAFSVPASAFVTQVNRATSQTLRMQATQEGLVPLKNWIKAALDTVVQVCMKQPDLEFVWVGDDAVDPLQQARTLNILVSAGIKTRDEARAELGLGEGKAGGVAKSNDYHDARGRFSTADNALTPGSGAAATQGAIGPPIEPPPYEPIKPVEPIPEPAPPGRAEPAGEPRTATPNPQPLVTIADKVAPNGVLPGVPPPGSPGGRNMPASDDPNQTALEYVTSLMAGQVPVETRIGGTLPPGMIIVRLRDGTYITFRPAGVASERAPNTMATVDINNEAINLLNGGSKLELKFPKR